MKKTFLLITCCILFSSSFGQALTRQQKYYYTCKVFGFVKYFHSGVSTCSVNWDSVLVSILPAVDTALTQNGFNDVMDSLLMAAGPMAIAPTPLPDTLPAALKRNRNFGWISDPIFRSDVQVILDTIKNNFRPHPECWTQYNTYTSAYDGFLVMPYDSVEVNVNTYTAYPGEYNRLLMLFKYWNVVNYFYPYNYSLDLPWDATLNQFIVPVADAPDGNSLYLLYEQITSNLNDAHVEGLTYAEYYFTPPGYYQPYIILRYIENKYVVVKTNYTSINVGDAILSIDGKTTAQWEDSLQHYISAGNPSVFRRFMCASMLAREVYNLGESLVVQDSTGAAHTVAAICSGGPYQDTAFFNYQYNYYPADSLRTISWTTMQCNTGYVNMGNLQPADVGTMYSDLSSKPAIIFDLRNYPNGTGWEIANLMYPSAIPFAKFTIPDITYPGTYSWEYDSLGVNGNTTPYLGKVIILMNEETQSQAEFTCMILGAMANSVKVGSQTAGTDGDVSWWQLSDDLGTGFTTLGVYYPNGDSTERIGIVPDSVVNPTQAGIRHGHDEVLEKALTIAGCNLAAPSVTNLNPMIRVYPNPANDIVNIEAVNINTDLTIQLTDVTGRVLLQKELPGNQRLFTSLDIKTLAAGMYFVTVQTGGQQYITKIVKE